MVISSYIILIFKCSLKHVSYWLQSMHNYTYFNKINWHLYLKTFNKNTDCILLLTFKRSHKVCNAKYVPSVLRITGNLNSSCWEQTDWIWSVLIDWLWILCVPKVWKKKILWYDSSCLKYIIVSKIYLKYGMLINYTFINYTL